MPVFVDPDELKSSSLFPSLPDVMPCPGLEALTGADFAIARLPLVINPSTLETHIKNRTLFANRKSGYDALGDFNQIWLEIARMKKCNIPMQQAFILPIGIYQPKEDGVLRIQGKKPIDSIKNISYETYLKNEAEWGYAGVQVRRLNDESEIATFIKAQSDELLRVEGRLGKREVYPNRPEPNFEPDDIWQEVDEIDKADIRYFLCAGLFGFGPKLANTVRDYANQNTPKLDSWGVYYLKLLSDEDTKGKPIHKIPGWGDKRRADLRQILGLPPGYNLSANEIEVDEGKAFFKGWFAALKSFKEMVDAGHKPIVAWQALLKQANEFVNLDGFFKD